MTKKSGPGSRVVICCYCDSRSLLPKGESGRLVCHGCGAPISVIERLEPSHNRKSKSKKRAQIRPAEHAGAHASGDYSYRRQKSKKGRKRKGLLYHLHDAVDDIFELDDLFDFFD
ncbi:MAG: hypothetical protein AAGC81_09990 [Pseudomonadota bacterium]